MYMGNHFIINESTVFVFNICINKKLGSMFVIQYSNPHFNINKIQYLSVTTLFPLYEHPVVIIYYTSMGIILPLIEYHTSPQWVLYYPSVGIILSLSGYYTLWFGYIVIRCVCKCETYTFTCLTAFDIISL